MAGSFDDKARIPDDKVLSKELGQAMKLWNALIEHVSAEQVGVLCEWKFYGAKHGWQLKVSARKRAVLYMVPHQGSFLAAMAMNEKAVTAVRTSGLPPDLIREIEDSKAYPEGRPARVEVSAREHVEVVKRLLAIKLSP